MNLRVVVGVLIVIAGGIYLLTQGFFRSGDFEELNAGELAQISAFLAKGSKSDKKAAMFTGELQPAWDEMGFKDKNIEAERIADNLRAQGIRHAHITLRKRAVIDMGPTSMQLHEFPQGVRPKQQVRPDSTSDDLAPAATDP